MLHSRTDTAQDDLALWYLSGFEFKVYRYLVNRADPIGVCYPSEEKIAWAIAGEKRHVQRALAVLNDSDVFRYRRKNEFDRVTRRKYPNVYQVNPDILVIALEFEAEARAEWLSLINQCGNRCCGLWSPYNQHQEPTPEPTPVTSSRTSTTSKSAWNENGKNNAAPDYTNQPDGDGKNKNGTRGGKHNDLTHQRGAQASKSSVPAPRPKFTNPKAVNEAFVSPEHEALAASIQNLGIGLPLARGFVVEYGVDRARSALDETVLMGAEARKPAAVFRAILQTRLADEVAVARQKFFNQKNQQ